MNRAEWISKKIFKDLRTNWKNVLKMIGAFFFIIAMLKVLAYFGLKELFLPIMFFILPVAMILYWYSIDYDIEQKKIIEKLKGDK